MATKLTLVSVKHGLQEWDAGWPARCVVGEDLPYLPTRWLFAVGNLVTTKASSYSQALFEIKVSFGESGQRTVLVTGTQMRTALRNLRVPGQDDADWDLVCAHDPVGRLGMLASSAAAVVLTRKVGWLAGALFAATVVAGLRARPRPSSAQCEAAATRLLTAARTLRWVSCCSCHPGSCPGKWSLPLPIFGCRLGGCQIMWSMSRRCLGGGAGCH
jgi:hypothetical protein